MISASFPLFAEDRCGVPSQINELIDLVSRHSAKDGELPKDALRTLERELLKTEHVMTIKSGDLGLGEWKPAFDWMIIATRDAVRNGKFSEPDRLRTRVGALIVGMRFSCIAGVGSSKVSTTSPMTGASSGSDKNSFGQSFGETVRNWSVLQQSLGSLAAVLILGSTFFLLAWITELVFKWFRIYVLKSLPASAASTPSQPHIVEPVFNQHKCQIPAQITIGLSIIEGEVVALDEVSAQFHPESEEGYQQIRELMQEEHPHLAIEAFRIPYQILNLHQGYVNGFFNAPMDKEMMDELLKASVTPTIYTPLPPASVA